MVEGGGVLELRDAEPHELASPTTVTGTVDTDTGAISGGSLSTPQVKIRQDITSPLPASVFIDADFSQVAPISGVVDHEGNVSVQVALRVDLHVEVQEPGGGLVLFANDCTAAPINLVLQGRYADGQVTLVDDNFSVPEVTIQDPGCGDSSVIRPAIDEQLAGPGHSLTLTLVGSLALPPPPGCETATTLAASPVGGAVLGASVDLTATVSIPNPAQAECVEATNNGQTTEGGRVEFLDGDNVIGSAAVQADGTAVLTTTDLTAGNREVTARFGRFTPFNASTSPIVAYRVTPNPAITATLPEHHRIGATDPTEFDLTVANTGFGRDIERGRIDITLKPADPSPNVTAPANRDLKPDRVVLEHRDDAGTWVPVSLTPQTVSGTNKFLWGSIGDLTGFTLDVGESVTQRLRIRFPFTGGPLATSTCGATQETCPGLVDVTFELIEVDETGAPAAVIAPAPDALTSAKAQIALLEATRRPSTITIGSSGIPAVTPQTVRNGGTVSINTVQLGPNLGSRRPLGDLTVLLDGQPISFRPGGSSAGNVDTTRYVTSPDAANHNLMFDVPPGTTPGVHAVTVRYSGSELFLPQQATRTFTVIEPVGTLFDCDVPSFDSYRFRTFVEAQATMLSTAPAGTEVDLRDVTLTMKFAREHPGSSGARGQIVPNNGTRAVGTNSLGIDLGFGPVGAGTGASLTRTFGVAMGRTGFGGADPDPSVVDELIVINNPSGTVTVDGTPGELAPVTLDRIRLQAISGGIILVPMTCTPVAEPLLLGEVMVSGHTLAVEPGGRVREGDEVTLRSTVAPYTTGQVEFRAGDETIAVSLVKDGVATAEVDDLPEGAHSLTAIYTGGVLAPPLVSNAVEVTVLPPLACKPFAVDGNGAVVRLVYIELLGRCPDQAGYSYWKSRLDAGTSPEAFARAIARTPEAVGRVVDDAYQTMLGRPADAAGRAFWVGRLLRHGRYDQLLADLAASGEFWSKAGGTNVGFVTRVYEQLLGRAPDTAGLDFWTAKLSTGTSRRALVLTLANLNEPLGRLVSGAYDEILSRTPNTDERTAGIAHLRSTGDRSGLYAELIGLEEFSTRAQEFPNPED